MLVGLPAGEFIQFSIADSNGNCSNTSYWGILNKHCWKQPRPRGREPYHADSSDQPRGPNGRFLPFTDNRGNRDSFSSLRWHHKSGLYYSHCLLVPCNVDIRDGATRTSGSNILTFADGDKIFVGGCCSEAYTVVFVSSVVNYNGKCYKKVYILRNEVFVCANTTYLFKSKAPITCLLSGTDSCTIIMTVQGSDPYWSGSCSLSCGDTVSIRIGCNFPLGGGRIPENGLSCAVKFNSLEWGIPALPLGYSASCNPLYVNFWAATGINCSDVRISLVE